MKNVSHVKPNITDRRGFLQAMSLAAGSLPFFPLQIWGMSVSSNNLPATTMNIPEDLSIIGDYGSWAANLLPEIPALSFRKGGWESVGAWRDKALERFMEYLAMPEMTVSPEVKVDKSYTYDGLYIEELSWQLPYGNPTQAILLKPERATTPLPGILAFHDHGGNKYFGRRKITRTSDEMHPLMEEHQSQYYEGRAWANELAKRGYIVLVSDAFPFASRRVMLSDVPEIIHRGLTDINPEDPDSIQAYNQWAANHEHILSKSLFCAGTTWPGVFLSEDKVALDILSARADVQSDQLGCAGLSGGGMRTVFIAGTDPRVKCAVPVGFMTTWRDFLLNKAHTHTWMVYVPVLPKYLDFPEILGLRAPLPTLVQNDEDDQLYTLPEMKRADQILREVYQKMDADDQYRCSFYPGLHKFDIAMQEEAFDWFDQWLK